MNSSIVKCTHLTPGATWLLPRLCRPRKASPCSRPLVSSPPNVGERLYTARNQFGETFYTRRMEAKENKSGHKSWASADDYLLVSGRGQKPN